MRFFTYSVLNPVSVFSESVFDLHNVIFSILFFIFYFFIFMFFFCLFMFYFFPVFFYDFLYFEEEHHLFKVRSRFNSEEKLEFFWSLLPIFLLIIICFFSVKVLFLSDFNPVGDALVKCIGHQWYWSYEYDVLNTVDITNLELYEGELGKTKSGLNKIKEPGYQLVADSYLAEYSDSFSSSRLLATDFDVLVPQNRHIKFVITSADVIHSWCLPSAGIKVDAIPGRLNQITIFFEREGVFYGQCSELCGANHGFMPICVRSLPPDDYIFWFFEVTDALSSVPWGKPFIITI